MDKDPALVRVLELGGEAEPSDIGLSDVDVARLQDAGFLTRTMGGTVALTNVVIQHAQQAQGDTQRAQVK